MRLVITTIVFLYMLLLLSGCASQTRHPMLICFPAMYQGQEVLTCMEKDYLDKLFKDARNKETTNGEN